MIKSDIYSLGVIFWELYAKKDPMEGVNPIQIAKFVIEERRDPISKNTPKKIKKLIKKCWHLDPEERPKMGFIVQRLRQSKEIQEVTPREVTPWKRRFTSLKKDFIEGMRTGCLTGIGACIGCFRQSSEEQIFFSMLGDVGTFLVIYPKPAKPVRR